MLHDYFETNRIPDFRIEDIKLQIVGNYTDNRKNTRKKRWYRLLSISTPGIYQARYFSRNTKTLRETMTRLS
jgi:hypothetical protein